jgi:hypothetical protein
MDKRQLTREDVYGLVKDRKAYVVFRNLEAQLTTMPYDGTNIHHGGLIQCFSSFIQEYDEGNSSKDETIKELKNRNESFFNDSIRYIREAVNKFGVNP